jgi:ribose-phosphate pyrophosphokinase
MELLAKAPLDELVVTNTIPLQERALGKIRVLSVAPLLAEAIIRVHRDLSVSALFQ